MKLSVIVPTYRRVSDLARCLIALQQQQHAANEVIVVVRDTDAETRAFLDAYPVAVLPLQVVLVYVPGVIAAMNTGVAAATGDIVIFTDDDAAPHIDWLARITAYYQTDTQIGGVGGRDLIQRSEPWFKGERAVVGLLQWHGRLIGEHHRGVGAARAVDVLKGVNMSFRKQVFEDLQFDDRLRGSGAQVHFEVAFCLALRRKGWKLIYDPNILVDHYIAQRFDEDQRHQFNAIALINAVHNETLALLEHLAWWQRFIFLVWAIIVGTRQSLGFVQWLRLLPSEKMLATQKLLASLQGRWQGWQTWRQSQRGHSNLQMTTTSL